jgi:hypothetical protein
MMRTDNYSRIIILDGIPADHTVDCVNLNEHGNLEILTKDVNGVSSSEQKAITIRDLRGTDHDENDKTRRILEDLTDRACKNKAIESGVPRTLSEFTDWLRNLYPELFR